MVRRALITDNTHPVLAETLTQAGWAVDIETHLDYDALLAVAGHYDALVVRSKVVIDRRFIDHCPQLRCIGRVGAGMETIDVEYAEQKGIRCLNSPEGNRDAVGEHAVGLLLALLNHIARADSEVRGGRWLREANRGIEVMNKTIGIIGFGHMGSAFARRLSGFGCRVMAYDLLGNNATGFEREPWVECVALPQLQHDADVVSLHLPWTADNHHWANSEFFDTFAKAIYLINTSRGAVVDTRALAEAMQQGRVAGAALDVIEYEDMTKDGIDMKTISEDLRYIMQSDRTVLTPHVAGWTAESKYKLAAVLAEKIVKAVE